jgi:phage gpG-like protein
MSGKTYTMPQFRKALLAMDGKIRGGVLAKAAMAGGLVIEGQAKINAIQTFDKQSGNLANSIQTKLASSSASRAVVSIGPTAVYGRIQEFGGVIKPVTAKRLHWVSEDGEHHFAMSVTLPPRPYLRPAIDEHENEIMRAVGENLRIEIEGAI